MFLDPLSKVFMPCQGLDKAQHEMNPSFPNLKQPQRQIVEYKSLCIYLRRCKGAAEI